MLCEKKKNDLDPSIQPILHQESALSVLGGDPSSIQVWWISVQWFLYHPAVEPMNQPSNRHGQKHIIITLAEVINPVNNC